MFFGRNEEEGLRCVYHGWKFDVTGACVDMPSRPAKATSRTRCVLSPTMRRAQRHHLDLHGNSLDAAAAARLQQTSLRRGIGSTRRCASATVPGDSKATSIRATRLPARRHAGPNTVPPAPRVTTPQRSQRSPEVTVRRLLGTTYGAYRPAEEDSVYWRIAQLPAPLLHNDPTGLPGREVAGKRMGAVDDRTHYAGGLHRSDPRAVEGPGVGGPKGHWTVRNQPQNGLPRRPATCPTRATGRARSVCGQIRTTTT